MTGNKYPSDTLLYYMGIDFWVLIRAIYGVQHAHRRHSNYQRGITAAYKRQGQAGRRNGSTHYQRVYYYLYAVNERYAGSEQKAESVLTTRSDTEAAVDYKAADKEECGESEKAQLLPHNRHYKVTFGKWKKAVFLGRVEKPHTEQTAVTECVQRLNQLIAVPFWRCPRVNKRAESL